MEIGKNTAGLEKLDKNGGKSHLIVLILSSLVTETSEFFVR